MKHLRVAVVGCGFWSRFQVPAWLELSDVDCVAVCDVDEAKARQTAKNFGIGEFYSDAARMIREERPDVLDVITQSVHSSRDGKVGSSDQDPSDLSKADG